MRVVLTLLIGYILSISLLPCADGLVADDCGQEIHLHSDSQHSDEGLPHADDCSPFCSCHCCHVHAGISVHSAVFGYLAPVGESPFGESQIPNHYHPGIFRPPVTFTV